MVLRHAATLLSLQILQGGCTCGERSTPPVVVEVEIAPTLLLELKQSVTCADRGAGGRLVAGTSSGQILLVRRRGDPAASLQSEPVRAGPVTHVELSDDGRRLLSVHGEVVALWDLDRGELLRRVQGPQPVTAALLLPGGEAALFGTSQGHVLRWDGTSPRAAIGLPDRARRSNRNHRQGATRAHTGGTQPRSDTACDFEGESGDGRQTVRRSRARPIRGFACGGTQVPRARMRLPAKKRCPYGAYVEPDEGPVACLYPVTQLVLLGRGRVLRACRTGEAALIELATRRLSFLSPGHLGTLTPVGDDLLLLGRADGKLRLYDLSQRKVVRELAPAGAPSVSASDKTLIAAVQGTRLRLWHRDHPQAVGEARLPGEAVWLELGPVRARGGGPSARDTRLAAVLLKDGRLLEYRLKVSRVAR